MPAYLLLVFPAADGNLCETKHIKNAGPEGPRFIKTDRQCRNDYTTFLFFTRVVSQSTNTRLAKQAKLMYGPAPPETAFQRPSWPS